MYDRHKYFQTLIFWGKFGFQRKHSTVHTFLLLTDTIQRSIDQSNYSCGIFIDLGKAFDTVNHSILLAKLDDANLFLSDCNLHALELKLNEELVNIHTWLCADKLSLSIEKTGFVLFHAPQKKVNQNIILKIFN